MRIKAAAIVAAAALLVVSPALADKPTAVLKGVERLAVSAIPIDFDRDNRWTQGSSASSSGAAGSISTPDRRSSAAIPGLIVDPSGKSLLAISDAGTWLRADIDYDGRKLKGLSDASIGPVLGRGGKPLATDAERDFGRYRARRRRHIEGHRLRLLRAQPSHPALSLHPRALRTSRWSVAATRGSEAHERKQRGRGDRCRSAPAGSRARPSPSPNALPTRRAICAAG